MTGSPHADDDRRRSATGTVHPGVDAVPGPVVALAFDYPPGLAVPRHRHCRSQLVFAPRGVMTVTTEMGSWTLPSQRALWVPAEIEHGIRTTGEVHLRTLYVEPGLAPAGSAECHALSVSGLLRELILRAVELGPTLRAGGAGSSSGALVELLLEELDSSRRAPLHVLHLPEGADPRLRRLMARLRDDPGDRATLREWGRRVGASERTLARLFAAETGLSFGRWRQQLRLQRALALLATDRSVGEVALDIGYDSLSAFITMFRRATGTTPSAYRRESADR